MDELVLISTMSILVLLSAFCSIVLKKLKFPSLIGFLLAGIIVANFIDVEDDTYTIVETLSTLGLVMLMFSIGMEIDVRKLRTQGRFAIIVAAVQLPLMVAGGVIAGTLLGYNMLQSITLGCIISGSSTAVVMAVLKSQGKLDNAHIELLVLITIMEDIGQVVMLSILTPMLSGGNMDSNDLILLIVKIAIFMITCFTLGMYIVPKVINWFYKRANDELISLLCIGAAFTLAWAASGMGLSVAIGAFLAGVFVGSTKPKHAVEEFVEPLKSLFMAMFFISVGMEVTLSSLVDNWMLILIFFAVFVICKSSTVFLGYWVGNGDGRNGFVSALSLCAMGEFAFIISKEAYENGVVDQAFYSSVIGAALVSMIVLPLLTDHSEQMYDGIEKHMPDFLRRFAGNMTRHRDNLYKGLGTLSNNTRAAFTKGLANIYFIIVVIVLVEMVFYSAYDPLCGWLVENLGRNDFDWRIMILILNLLVLIPLCKRGVDSIRLSLYVLDQAKKNVDKKGDTPLKQNMIKFHETMSPLIIGAVIAIIIVMLVPNGIDNLIHIRISLALVMLMMAYQAWKYYKGIAGDVPKVIEENETDHS